MTVNMVKQRTAILFVFLVLLCACGIRAPGPEKKITIKVTAGQLPPEAQIYIVGDQPELGSWDPNDVLLEKQPDGSWSQVFRFVVGTKIEYKITRGSWQSEAVDSTGLEFPNFVLTVRQDSTIFLTIPNWRDLVNRPTLLSQERLRNKADQIELIENWRFNVGDDSSWARPNVNDSDWSAVNPSLAPGSLNRHSWPGIGWFRLHLMVDSSLWRTPLAFYFWHAGVSEIYLNGRLLYRLGRIATSEAAEIHTLDQNPKSIIFDPQTHQVLAIRYSNFKLEKLHRMGLNAGFEMTLGDVNVFMGSRVSEARLLSIYQLIFSIIPVTLSMLHFLFFIFYPGARQNIFYAICMLGFAAVAFFDFQNSFASSIEQILLFNKIAFIASNVALIFGLLTSYSRSQEKIPGHFYLLIIASLGFITWRWFWPARSLSFYFNFFLIASGLELLRVIFKPPIKREGGDWILALGLLALVIAVTLHILINRDILEPIAGNRLVYVYGVLALSIAMSINLARDFARANEKLLERERQAHEQEISRRILEADNARKTRELEEARTLQLSMLPNRVPDHPGVAIAVFMKTATEVGGDYYDFLEEDGALTIALGDATGHGTKAGIMVTLIKSLFNTMGNAFYLPDFFKHCTRMIKQMRLGHLYMALMLLRVRDHQVILSSAGMPPVLHFSQTKQLVDEITLKGMPLGAVIDFSYQQRKFELAAGDTLLLMSDGFPELFNDKMEQFDYPRARAAFAEVAEKPPDEIIAHLTATIERWSNGNAPNDDITFVVLKAKGQRIS